MTGSRSAAGARRAAGFTLIELMIALSIVGILLAVAVPSFREAMMNVRISAQTNDLMTDLSIARSEAVKRNLPVLLCTSKDGLACGGSWSDGWIVFVDADNSASVTNGDLVMKTRPAAEGNNSIVATAGTETLSAVSYRPTGLTGNKTIVKFSICDSRTTTKSGREVEITVTGRAKATPVVCGTSP
jgi:type IV fimbrial biogenesis protein FimT